VNGDLAVGRIGRAHGVHGEVAVRSLTERSQRFAGGSRLRLEDGRTLTVERARPHRHDLLVKFEEVPDRTAA
jgi:16S rRNA processing protein RimM